MSNDQAKLEYIKQHIGVYEDFPKEGIVFRDLFGALTDGQACQYLRDLLLNYVRAKHPDVQLIVGLDARGFLFNFMLATELGVGCAPIRKKGKLPGDVVSIEYDLEYGTSTFEMQRNAIKPGQKVILVDDLLATGGSLDAAVKLVRKAGGIIVTCLVIMELEFLKGRQRLDCNVHSLIQYN